MGKFIDLAGQRFGRLEVLSPGERDKSGYKLWLCRCACGAERWVAASRLCRGRTGKNDPVGRVVEKILGKGNAPAAIPNDVADFLYGASGVNPGTLNVAVANRVKAARSAPERA